jgi:phospholipase D3/4
MNILLQSSPPAFLPSGRENDLSAILHTINSSREFVHIAVMDYAPAMLYVPVKR